MKKYLKYFLFVFLSIKGFASDQGLKFNLKVKPEFQGYSSLLEDPALVCLALKTAVAEMFPATLLLVDNPSSVRIERSNGIPFKTASLKFLKRRGQLFIYEGSVDWGLQKMRTQLKISMELDLTELNSGKAFLQVHMPLSKFVPKTFTATLNQKVEATLSPINQERFLAYLERIDNASRAGATGKDRAQLNQRIWIDAFNKVSIRAVGPPRRLGDAEPISDQILLLVTLAIWLIALPTALGLLLLWKRLNKSEDMASPPPRRRRVIRQE